LRVVDEDGIDDFRYFFLGLFLGEFISEMSGKLRDFCFGDCCLVDFLLLDDLSDIVSELVIHPM
jgi:hypothetical protein